MLFNTAQEVTKYLEYYWKQICCQELSKIAQSGHTGHNNATLKLGSFSADEHLLYFTYDVLRLKFAFQGSLTFYYSDAIPSDYIKELSYIYTWYVLPQYSF